MNFIRDSMDLPIGRVSGVRAGRVRERIDNLV